MRPSEIVEWLRHSKQLSWEALACEGITRRRLNTYPLPTRMAEQLAEIFEMPVRDWEKYALAYHRAPKVLIYLKALIPHGECLHEADGARVAPIIVDELCRPPHRPVDIDCTDIHAMTFEFLDTLIRTMAERYPPAAILHILDITNSTVAVQAMFYSIRHAIYAEWHTRRTGTGPAGGTGPSGGPAGGSEEEWS